MSVLEDMLEKAKAELATAQKAEMNAAFDFKMLKQKIEDFECELSELQTAMTQVAHLNQEIAQQCEHWEQCHEEVQAELVSK